MHEITTPAQRAAAILRTVRSIKRGTFASYGEVARRAGLPGRARLVGTVLRELGDSRVPWHRVTGAGGRIAFPLGSANARKQLRLLAREGLPVRGSRVQQKPQASSHARSTHCSGKCEATLDRYVVFSHGKDAGPWGVKITALAGNARSEGYEVESVDYRGIDDPRARVNKLVEFCKELKGDLVLCGSSLGGYVSVAAASLLHARGVFLMAPALTMPGLPPLREKLLDCPTTIVHGWKDDVVPVEQSMEFARRHGCALHILNSDHRLQDEVRFLKYLFEYFLISLDLPQDVS